MSKINVIPHNIVAQNTTIKLRCNKIVVKNMSNRLVILFRTYTLIPGEVFILGSEDNNDILESDMNISIESGLFDSNKPDAKRVEILEIHKIDPDLAFSPTEPRRSILNDIEG